MPEPVTIRRRTMPRAVYHVTTEHHWQKIQHDNTLKQGKGEGWEERHGVFALGWNNWLQNLHYLPFLILKLKGKCDRIVILRIELSAELRTKTRVGLLASTATPTGAMLLEKACAGRFSGIRSAEDVVLIESYGSTLIRNTFPLNEFVKELPASDERIEYVIESDVPLRLVQKIAEIELADIPANFLITAKRLERRLQYRRRNNLPVGQKRRVKILVTDDDRKRLSFLIRTSRARLKRKT